MISVAAVALGDKVFGWLVAVEKVPLEVPGENTFLSSQWKHFISDESCGQSIFIVSFCKISGD